MTPISNFERFIDNYIPSLKRLPKWLRWFYGLISSMVRTNVILREYIDGVSISYWDSGTSYAIDVEIIFNYQVYKSLTSSNLNKQPDLNPNNWEFILPSFIGIDERGKYAGGKLLMEWELNRYFKKELTDNGFIGFRQPDDPINPTPSDIFIENVEPEITSFISYTVEENTSVVFVDRTVNASFTTEIFGGTSTYLFNVNIPEDVYSDINSNSDIAEKIVRNFLDRYVPAGLVYNIVTY